MGCARRCIALAAMGASSVWRLDKYKRILDVRSHATKTAASSHAGFARLSSQSTESTAALLPSPQNSSALRSNTTFHQDVISHLPSLQDTRVTSQLNLSHSPWAKGWNNSIMICSVMKNENITDVREWLQYYRCAFGVENLTGFESAVLFSVA